MARCTAANDVQRAPSASVECAHGPRRQQATDLSGGGLKGPREGARLKIQSEKNITFDIEIDGGINFDNCKIAIEAGANILVSGTTVFKSNNGDIKKNINLLKLK